MLSPGTEHQDRIYKVMWVTPGCLLSGSGGMNPVHLFTQIVVIEVVEYKGGVVYLSFILADFLISIC